MLLRNCKGKYEFVDTGLETTHLEKSWYVHNVFIEFLIWLNEVHFKESLPHAPVIPIFCCIMKATRDC